MQFWPYKALKTYTDTDNTNTYITHTTNTKISTTKHFTWLPSLKKRTRTSELQMREWEYERQMEDDMSKVWSMNNEIKLNNWNRKDLKKEKKQK